MQAAYTYRENVQTSQKSEKNARRGYRFGFNSQEKDNEVYGEGSSYTAEYWQYDPRLGRRWNVDPRPNPSISVYAAFANNPISYQDILGDTIRNGDRMAAEGYTNKANTIEAHKKEHMSANNISENMTRKDFIKNGGDKGAWKMYSKMNNMIKDFNNMAAYHTAQAAITDKILSEWGGVNSPNIYAEVNAASVDFILFSIKPYENENGQMVHGFNAPKYEGSPDNPTLVAHSNGIYQQNALIIKISQYTTPSAPQPSRHGPQYQLNHEAGHFMYIVKNTAAYIQFRLKQQSSNINNDGGHHPSDESGKWAIEYGKQKDKP